LDQEHDLPSQPSIHALIKDTGQDESIKRDLQNDGEPEEATVCFSQIEPIQSQIVDVSFQFISSNLLKLLIYRCLMIWYIKKTDNPVTWYLTDQQ
jgi:hypothetical protein